MKRTVVLAGASGLVGSRLLELLENDPTVEKIHLLARRPPEHIHKKSSVVITDFRDLDSFSSQFSGADILFCCIGTTMKKAGSREAFIKVDYQIPFDLAQMASKAGIKKFIAISSLGADPESSNFYLKTKGEMERDIERSFRFTKLAFLRPSLLLGPREEFRLGEKIGQFMMLAFSFLLRGRLKKYRPVLDITVAKAMLSISNSINNQRVYNSEEIQWLGR